MMQNVCVVGGSGDRLLAHLHLAEAIRRVGGRNKHLVPDGANHLAVLGSRDGRTPVKGILVVIKDFIGAKLMNHSARLGYEDEGPAHSR